MRIAYLAAGAAGMYCGSCLHDNTLAAALIRLGHDVVLAPIYTPIRTDERDVSVREVFVGGVHAYLLQQFPLLNAAPRWTRSWLDHPALLRFAARRAVSVNPAKLGALTASMLAGAQGRQGAEFLQAARWLAQHVRPEVVHLSNALMLGMAPVVAKHCAAPIVCTLSGEDAFIEKLPAPHYERVRSLLRERAAEVQAFIALNNYYADFMASYLDVPRKRIAVIPHGLNLEGHGATRNAGPGEPRRVGFLARVCADKGLHLLIEAAERVARRPEAPRFEVHAAGYLSPSDRNYLAEVTQKAARGPLAGRFHYRGEVTRQEKIALLASLDVFCTPTVYRESKGLPALEAWANGAPAVLPAHGAFPELVRATGGGLLHAPLDADDLADKLAQLLADPLAARRLGESGRDAVHRQYSDAAMAEATLAMYRRLAT